MNIVKSDSRIRLEEAKARVTIYKGKYYYDPSSAYKRMRERLKPIVVYCLITLFLVSCYGVSENEIIIKIVKNNNNWIEYDTDGGGVLFSKNHVYNVGDTVKFCK